MPRKRDAVRSLGSMKVAWWNIAFTETQFERPSSPRWSGIRACYRGRRPNPAAATETNAPGGGCFQGSNPLTSRPEDQPAPMQEKTPKKNREIPEQEPSQAR